MRSPVSPRGRDRDQWTRRAIIEAGGLGALGLSLGGWAATPAKAQDRGLAEARRLGSGADAPAKAVILLWLWGGPSHLDTFDMKPDAPLEYRGPFDSIATAVPGTRVCELLPGLAKRANKYAILRALHHESNDHGVAGTIALTGSIAGAVNLGGQAAPGAMRPSLGSIVGRLSQHANAPLPPYIILGSQLHQGLKKVVGEGGGVLGTAHDPFRLDYEPGIGIRLPNAELPADLAADRLRARWNWLDQVDPSHAVEQRSPQSMRKQYDLARTLISDSTRLAALDLDLEPAKVRDTYGRHRFGQCCLIARRLVESGVPFVQVNWSTHVEGPEDAGDGGWDMHDRYFTIMQDRHGWMLDKALSALLDDLEDRGLLSRTLVLAVGEFGRTPKINDKAGRDHWNLCYSGLMAGAGVQGGKVVGRSNKLGEHPVDVPATPADLGATVLGRMGFTAADLTAVGVAPLGRPITELF